MIGILDHLDKPISEGFGEVGHQVAKAVATNFPRDSATLATLATLATDSEQPNWESTLLRSNPDQDKDERLSILSNRGESGQCGQCGQSGRNAGKTSGHIVGHQVAKNATEEPAGVVETTFPVVSIPQDHNESCLELVARNAPVDDDRIAEATDSDIHVHAEIPGQALAWIAAGCPFEWALGVVSLQNMPAPTNFPECRWGQFQADAVAFAGSWSQQSFDAGWTAVELFGLSSTIPWYNWGSFGVVPMLNGHAISAIDADVITITTKTGAVQRHRRRAIWYDAVPAWGIGK